MSKVLAAVSEKVGDPHRMRALGFGVTIAHCEFLADRFNRVGITARAVSAKSTAAERDDALRSLAVGDVQILFSVDLFNEVIDVPAIDVVLMLRPTESAALAGFGASTATTPLPLQTVVYWHKASKTDLFFITLQKSEKHYSPTTRYRDYAISDRLFHWESQSTTAAASTTGQGYIHHEANGSNVVLFIRSTRTYLNGRTRPYFCAGRAIYVEHRSERPMQITWHLHDPLPGDTFSAFRAAVA